MEKNSREGCDAPQRRAVLKAIFPKKFDGCRSPFRGWDMVKRGLLPSPRQVAVSVLGVCS